MSAAGGAYPVFPPLPPFEKRVTTAGATTGGDTTTTVTSEEQKTALAEVDAAAKLEEQQNFKERKHAEDVALAEKEQADRELAIAEGQKQEMASPKALEVQRYIDQTKAFTRNEESRLAGMPSPALFADRQGWDKAKLALQIIGGGISEGMMAAAHLRLGMAAPQQHTVDSIIERDLERQRAAIAKQTDAVVRARTGIKDAEDARATLLAAVDLRGKEMYRRSELVHRGRLAALKYDQAAIDNDRKNVDFKNRQAEKKLDYVKGHSQVIQSKWESPKTTTERIERTEAAGAKGGGGVEADKNAANFALFREHGNWLAEQLPTLSKEEAAAISAAQAAGVVIADSPKVNAILSKAGIDTESGSSGRVKAYLDHMSRATDAIGRLKSGGAINADEDARFSGWFKPKASDTPEDRAMRSKNITGDINTMGDYLARTPKNAPAPSAPAAAPASEPAPAAKPTRSIGASAGPDPRLSDPAALAKARVILGDKKAPAAKREAARAFLKAAKELANGK